MKIEVNYSKLARFDDDFASLSKKMEHISGKVSKYSKSLDWEITASDNISANLMKATRSIDNQSQTLTNMSRFVTDAAKKYKEMDKAQNTSKLKEALKALTVGIKKVASGFEKVMGFIGKGIVSGIGSFANWVSELVVGDILAKGLESLALIIMKANLLGGQNNRFVKFVTGELFSFDSWDNALNKLNGKLQNSKLFGWANQDGKLQVVKNALKQALPKTTPLLKKLLKATPFAIVVGTYDLAKAINKTLKNDSLSAGEKAKQIFIDSVYIGGKALAVTTITTVFIAATAFTGPAALAAGMWAGLILEGGFNSIEDRAEKVIGKVYDGGAHVVTGVYENREKIGKVIQATVLPMSPQRIELQKELVKIGAEKLQMLVTPKVEEICSVPQEKQVIMQRINNQQKLYEQALAHNISMTNSPIYASNVVESQQIIINAKTLQYKQAYAM